MRTSILLLASVILGPNRKYTTQQFGQKMAVAAICEWINRRARCLNLNKSATYGDFSIGYKVNSLTYQSLFVWFQFLHLLPCLFIRFLHMRFNCRNPFLVLRKRLLHTWKKRTHICMYYESRFNRIGNDIRRTWKTIN